MKRILITGGGSAGHVTPNIALIPGLRALGFDIHYVGWKSGIEKSLIEPLGIPYHSISAGKLRRYFDIKNFTDILRIIQKVAAFKSTVLLQGESGTGKELFARHIHDLSPRSAHPMIVVNCGAIPENLLESELFGHMKGSFTGAHVSKEGLFEKANKGTLFLDEIGELPLDLQVKILRAIQEEEIMRDVILLEPAEDGVRLQAFFEEPLTVSARIGRIDFLKHTVTLVPAEEA